MAWPIIGRAFSPAEFEVYVRGLEWTDAFRPEGICLHNTAAPSLAQRPNGLTRQHMLNLEKYYKGNGWKGGPHLFIDDFRIWVFNDLTKPGTHSPSWNRTKLGIEMLGDFDKESFTEGRGAKVRENTIAAIAALNNVLGFPADAFKFHCEDKATDHACPGKLARAVRAGLVEEIATAMHGGPTPAADAVAADDSLPLDVDATESASAAAIPPLPKVGFRDRARVLQETIDMGSRLGTSIRNGLNTIYLLLFGAGAAGTAASTLLDPNKGNARVATDALSPYPVLFVALGALLIGVAITGGAAWWFFRRAGNGLVSAVKDQRYLPPKQATQDTVEG